MGQVRDLQKRVWANKVKNGFDKSTVDRDILLAQGELTEVFDAYRKELDDLDEELADVVLYMLGLAEKLGIDLEDALQKKLTIVEKRKWKKVNDAYYQKEEDDE